MDHLVGASNYWAGYGYAERPSCLEIDAEVETAVTGLAAAWLVTPPPAIAHGLER